MKKLFQILLSIFTMFTVVSCSNDREFTDDKAFDEFNIKEYIANSEYNSFSFSRVLDYVLYTNDIDEYSINSLAFSVVGREIDSFSISLSDTSNNRSLSAIYSDGIFKNRVESLDDSLNHFDDEIILLADTILQLDEFDSLKVSEVYFLSELSSASVDFSSLSRYDFFSLKIGENKVQSVASSELHSLNPRIVFSIYTSKNDAPKYIVVN